MKKHRIYVPKQLLQDFIRFTVSIYGGVTVIGSASGYWLDRETGATVEDDMKVVEIVMTSPRDIDHAIAYLKGRQEQAVYYEVVHGVDCFIK